MLKESVEHLRAQNPDELLALLCFNFQKLNFVSLWEHMGSPDFVSFLDRFSGCYIKVPPAKKMFRQIDLYRLAVLWRQVVQSYASRNPTAWHEAEERFVKEAKKHRLNYDRAKRKARLILKEIDAASKWWSEYQMLKQRQAKTEL